MLSKQNIQQTKNPNTSQIVYLQNVVQMHKIGFSKKNRIKPIC